MGILHVARTPLAQWHQLVGQAQDHVGLRLTDTVENYIALTLDAYIKQVDLATTVMAIDLLENIHISTVQNLNKLRSVGDQCMILSGLFPDRSHHKNLPDYYFMNLGRNAYYVLSSTTIPWQLDHSLFYQLFDNFSSLIHVLRTMRFLKNKTNVH